MIRNYFLTAFRNLLRNRLQTGINILGLAAGISACILILLYVQSEKGYDTYHFKSDRIFRLNSHMELDGQRDQLARNSLRAAPELTEMFPEIESYTRVMDIGKQSVWKGDRMFAEESVCFTDSTFFTLFDYQFLAGDPSTCLNEPRTVVLTRSVAEKYFGDVESAYENILKFQVRDYRVTGIVEDPVAETHLPFNFFLSMSSMQRPLYDQAMQDYFRMMTFSYLLVKEGTNVEALEKKFEAFYDGNIRPWIDRMQVSGELTFSLQQVSDIHLNTSWEYDYAGNSNPAYIYIFSIVGLFILIVACINYMNLSTARSGRRAKEVGIRMVAGATRPQLIAQFLVESLLITFISFLLSLALVEILLPIFNDLSGKTFTYATLLEGQLLIQLLVLVLFIGLLAGSYPAFYLSSVRVSEVLKLKTSGSMGLEGWRKLLSPASLRKALVVVQFSLAVALMIGTFIVFQQLEYMKTKDLGFNKEGLFVIKVPSDSAVNNRLPTLKNELGSRADVKGIASTSNIPGGGSGELYFVINNDGKRSNKVLGFSWVDEDYFDLMGVEVSGRNFRQDNPTDQQQAFIINEACAEFLGWSDPIGKELENGFGMKGKVIGVVKDYHYASLHVPIKPMVFMFSPKTTSNLLVRLSSPDLSESATAVLDVWKQYAPKHPLESYFLEDFINRNYVTETKMLTIFGYFSALTILISCLGLFGLASFSTEQRTKEIGIRKVLGASAQSISLKLTKEFLLLVVLANLIAWPSAWYFLNRWLQDFAFHVQIGFWPFLLSAVIAAFISIATVSGLAMRAAIANPVKALRYE